MSLPDVAQVSDINNNLGGCCVLNAVTTLSTNGLHNGLSIQTRSARASSTYNYNRAVRFQFKQLGEYLNKKVRPLSVISKRMHQQSNIKHLIVYIPFGCSFVSCSDIPFQRGCDCSKDVFVCKQNRLALTHQQDVIVQDFAWFETCSGRLYGTQNITNLKKSGLVMVNI